MSGEHEIVNPTVCDATLCNNQLQDTFHSEEVGNEPMIMGLYYLHIFHEQLDSWNSGIAF
jgi:hypothetical protein